MGILLSGSRTDVNAFVENCKIKKVLSKAKVFTIKINMLFKKIFIVKMLILSQSSLNSIISVVQLIGSDWKMDLKKVIDFLV